MTMLFKTKTVKQFKIMEWLVAQGITNQDIRWAELTGPDTVRITNHVGQYMELACGADGSMEIL